MSWDIEAPTLILAPCRIDVSRWGHFVATLALWLPAGRTTRHRYPRPGWRHCRCSMKSRIHHRRAAALDAAHAGATMLTDIVGSTQHAAALGDDRWRTC